MGTTAANSASIDNSIRLFEERYGLIVAGRDLVRLLGYRTPMAFRQAVHRKMLGLNTFFIEGRRGRCARTSDVVRWAYQRGALENQGGLNQTTPGHLE